MRCALGAGLALGAACACAATLTPRQIDLLDVNCVQCHVHPGIGVPQMGRPADWRRRDAQGAAVLLRHVVEGYRNMPPAGDCGACTLADLRALTRQVAGLDAVHGGH